MKQWRLVVGIMLCAMPAQAQTAVETVNVFLDCDDCDTDFIRTEIKYVNWVRDRAVADVHVLVSEEETGGGGDRFTFHFTGLRGFAGREDTLHYTSSNNDTDDEVRRGYTRTLSIGLVPYVARTANGLQQLNISWQGADTVRQAEPVTRQHDPWNFWVFTVGLNSSMDGEESQRSLDWEGQLEANRTTEGYKIQIELDGEYGEERFTLDEDDGSSRDITSIRKEYTLELLTVKSLGQHWSAGLAAQARKATFGNIELGLNGGPAVEFSLWPYREATRRSMVVRYSTRVRSFNYEELTIYDKLKETHPAHNLNAEFDMKQRWGSLSFEAEMWQYLHNTAFYQISTFGSANVRLFKGFSVNFYGGYARVRDQLALSQEELTPEEILLQQQELRTGYRYEAGVGVSYSFGSIFNNIVNPRF
jgi:hypothetical protein